MSHQHSVTPHSLDHYLESTADMRSAATRLTRLRSALCHPSLPTQLHVIRYKFDFNSVSDCILGHMLPILLPGGRWLLSFAFDACSTYAICWDALDPSGLPESGYSCELKPVYHVAFTTQRLDCVKGSWAQVQMNEDGNSVNVAVRTPNHLGPCPR